MKKAFTLKSYKFHGMLVWLFLGMVMLNSERTEAQNWSSFGNGGMTDWVFATAMYNGDLIAGGKFTSAGGVNANHIARWDGSQWQPLGLGVNGKVNALVEFNGNLIVGGEFTEAGGNEMFFIAIWDGTTWLDDLGDMGSTVTSLVVYNNKLIAGGYFTDADGIPANYIAQYDEVNEWAPLGGGMGGSQGQVMAMNVYNNQLIAGGFFTTAGGMPASHIASWNGSTWSTIGSGVQGIVYALGEYDNNLIAGGLFLGAGGISANHTASWDGNAWNALGSGVTGTFYQYVFALAVYNNKLVAGGYFTVAGGQTVDGVAQWDGSNWSPMGGGFFYNGSNVYGVHTLTNYGTELIAGGMFTAAGGASAAHIASWYEPSIGVNSLPDSDLFQVFPNPTTDNITLTGFPSETNLKFTIKDLSGRALQQGILTQEETWINLDKLSAGIYFISIQSTDLQTFKVVKR